MFLVCKPILNLFSIAIRLLPAFYFLSLVLSDAATYITEQSLGIYALTFRPFVYALLMLSLIGLLSMDKLNWFNKYFWCWVSGDKPYHVIYMWLGIVVGIFGSVCLLSGLVTVFISTNSPFSMFNLRDNLFHPFVATVLISPVVIAVHLHLKARKA